MTQENVAPTRKASWLELFFDLVFVVAVSATSTVLYKNLSFHGIYNYIFLFLPVWWIWMGFSYFTDQYEEDTILQRIALFPVMFGMLVLANGIPNAVNENATNFVLTYIALRILLIALYAVSWFQYSECRALTIRYVLGFILEAAIWIISLFFPATLHFAFWSIALLIGILTPPIAYLTTRDIPPQVSHMDERFGLFVLIVLGDTIVSVALGIKGIQWQMLEVLSSISGFCCAIAMWKLYFTYSDDNVIHRALRGGKWDIFWSFVYGYGHFLIFVSIPAFGVAINECIKQEYTIPTFKLILFGSPILYLIAITIVQYASCNACKKTMVFRLMAILALGIFAMFVSNALLPFAILYIAAIIFLLMMIEWYLSLNFNTR